MIDPIARLRGELQQLDAQRQSGAIGKRDYERTRAALERELLDRVLADPAAATATGSGPAAPAAGAIGAIAAAAPRAPTRLLSLLALAVLVLAGAGYWWTGSPQLATGVGPLAQGADPASPHDASDEQFTAAVAALAARLEQQPDNAEGWATLARSYMRVGRVVEALPAFAKALALVGDEPRLLADYADALAVSNNRSLEGEPGKLIERALKADPNSIKALALAGTADFNRKDYAGAVRHWEKLAQVAPPDSPFRDQLTSSIAEARQLGGLAAAAAPAAAPAPAPATAPAAAAKPAAAPSPFGPAASAAAGGAGVKGMVRLSAAVAAQASPTDTVFILARPAEGSRMPLAILRKQVKDLPLEFALDDTMAMTPATRLSLFPKIIVDARITKSGQAQAAPGDLTGHSGPIANNASGVVVEIREVVKN